MAWIHDYPNYLKSKHWKELAEETRRLAGYRCQLCNSEERLEIHHRTYDRLGDEHQSDLVCLCHKCHGKHHGKDNEPIAEFFDLIRACDGAHWPFDFATWDLLWAVERILEKVGNEELSKDFKSLFMDLTYFNTKINSPKLNQPNRYYPGLTVDMQEIEDGR